MSDKPGKSPMSGTIFENYTERYWLYRGIAAATTTGLRDRFGRATPRSTLRMQEGDAILNADRSFFEAAKAVALAEREAIADSLEQAGRLAEAALVRGRPALADWRKP